MNNHVHVIAVPQRPDSLARTMGRTHAQYARYLNLCRRSCGHVWHAPYYSCALGEAHFWNAMVYVEQNPVRAGIAHHAVDYEWSSAAGHVRNSTLGFLDLEAWSRRYDGATWKQCLEQSGDDECFSEGLQEATRTGRPYCNEATLQTYERCLGRRLGAQASGRPRKLTGHLEEEQARPAFNTGE